MYLHLSSALADALEKDRIERILALRTDRIGDLLWTTPALRALRKRFPRARLAVLASPYAAPALAGNPNVDDVLTLARDRRRPWKTWSAERSAARRLAARRFDLAVVFARGKGENVRLARRAGIPFVVGMEPGLDGGRRPPRPEHPAAEDLGVVMALGAGPEPLDLDLFVPPEDAAWADAFVADAGLTAGTPLLGIHPGCGEFVRRRGLARERVARERRLWPAERLAALAADFAKRRGGRVLVTGIPAEAGRAAPVLAALGAAGIDAVGRTTVGRLAALIARCDAFVAPDTGPMHMAAALGVPLVALFGYQDPAVTGPVGRRGPREVIRHPFPCSPCHGWVKQSCREAICMRAIEVDEVAAALDRVLERRP